MWSAAANVLGVLLLCVLACMPFVVREGRVNDTDLFSLPVPVERVPVSKASDGEPMAAIYNTEDVMVEASKWLLEGDAERAEGLFRQAMKLAQEQRHKVLHARALCGLGCAEARGHKAHGMETLGEARRAFEQLDMKDDPQVRALGVGCVRLCLVATPLTLAQYVSLLVVIGGSLGATKQLRILKKEVFWGVFASLMTLTRARPHGRPDAALAVLGMACSICRAQPSLRQSPHFVSALTVLG